MSSETRPRGPIAAMFGSPGPVYLVRPVIGYENHSTCSRYKKGPAFSFGMRTYADSNDKKSPGPCYALPSRYYHDGPDGIPCYSLTSRPNDLKLHSTPGPGAYTKENSDNIAYRKGPCYSLKGRHSDRGVDGTPAPNCYMVPSAIGPTPIKRQCPVYSIRGRSKIGGISEDLSQAPGPGTYNAARDGGAPAYSITGRNEMPGDATMKPGPGAYNVLSSYTSNTPCRSYSFGIRHSQYTAPMVLDADND